MMRTLNMVKYWQMAYLNLGDETEMTRVSELHNETVGQLYINQVYCRSSKALSILSEIFDTCSQWSLGTLHLVSSWSMSSGDWSKLARVAGKGKIDKVEVSKENIWQGEREDVDAVKRVAGSWHDWI